MTRINIKVALGLAAFIVTGAVTSCAKTEAGDKTVTSVTQLKEVVPMAAVNIQDKASKTEKDIHPKDKQSTNIQLKKSPATGYKISFNDKTYFASTPGLQAGKLVFDPEVRQYANITNQVTLVTTSAKIQELKDMLVTQDIVTGVFNLGDTTLSLRVKSDVEFQGLLQQVRKEFSDTAIEVVLFYSGNEAF